MDHHFVLRESVQNERPEARNIDNKSVSQGGHQFSCVVSILGGGPEEKACSEATLFVGVLGRCAHDGGFSRPGRPSEEDHLAVVSYKLFGSLREPS